MPMKYVGNKLLHELEGLRQSGKFGIGTLLANEQHSLIVKLDDIAIRLNNRLKNPPKDCGRIKYPLKAGTAQDSFILNVLFSSSKHSPRNSYAATMLCASSFTEWCKQSILEGCLPGELLLRASLEFHTYGVLNGDYFTQGGLSNSPLSMFHYRNVEQTALFGCPIDAQTSLLLSLFGFRQAFENRCKRMIGYQGAEPILKYHDGIFADVLGAASGLKDHTTAPHVPICELAKLADWTNLSIHNQIIPSAWKIWKLFDLSRWFFLPPKFEDETRSWNIYGNFSCSVDVLQAMRDDFVSRLQQAVQKNPNHAPRKYTLHWENHANQLELVIEDKDELAKLKDKTVVKI